MDEHIRIRNRRKEIGMSQEELATAVGYSTRSTIARMESGDNKVDISKIELFAKALHTSSAYILGIDETAEPLTSPRYTATTNDERQLLAAYRFANAEGKAVFKALTALILSKK
jgi:transcriptional regulator with XRE-family HTH domain